MILENNTELNEYIKMLALNIYSCNKFDSLISCYTEKKLTPFQEADILSKMKFLNIDLETLEENVLEFTQNPFVKNVKIPHVNLNTISCKHVTIPSETAIITDNLTTKNDEFLFYRKLGYFNENITIPVLFEKDRLWMSPTLLETRSMKKSVDDSKGNVLIFGLGMGYFPYMCLQKDNVSSVTIVEKNKEIIEFFNSYIIDFFPDKSRINIINGDLFDLYNEDFVKDYDYIFVDTYEGPNDGTLTYMKLISKNVPVKKVSFWLEDMIFQCLKNTIIIYLSSMQQKRFAETLMSSTGITFILLKKIHKYFRENNITISTPEGVRSIILDRNILDHILKM